MNDFLRSDFMPQTESKLELESSFSSGVPIFQLSRSSVTHMTLTLASAAPDVMWMSCFYAPTLHHY